jgi:hypothetical protein
MAHEPALDDQGLNGGAGMPRAGRRLPPGLELFQTLPAAPWLPAVGAPLALALAIALTVGAGLVAVALLDGNPERAVKLLRDPAAVMGGAFWLGNVATLGIMLCSATAGVCLFAAAALRSQNPAHARFLAAAGALTSWIALDNGVMLHEGWLVAFGIPEAATTGLTLSLGAVVGLLGLRLLAAKAGLLAMAAAGGAIFLSFGLDLWSDLGYAGPGRFGLPMMVEDLAKFIGFTLACGCLWTIAWTGIRH